MCMFSDDQKKKKPKELCWVVVGNNLSKLF